MLVANVIKIPDFKGQADIEGFNHYVVYNENDFLVDRVKQALMRQWSLKKGDNDKGSITGVRSLIPMDKVQNLQGIDLPIIKTFEISDSRQRLKYAEELEKFFAQIGGTLPSENLNFIIYLYK
jgi:hypothetical protein